MTDARSSTPWPATAFDLLFAELERSCGFTPAQSARAKAVFASWGGGKMCLPSPRRQLLEAALAAAQAAVRARTPGHAVRERLVGMGLSRSAAYRVLRLACARHCSGGPHGAA